MGYGEIRKVMRKLEDQQRGDYKRHSDLIKTVINTVELNRSTRQRDFATLSARIINLESSSNAWQTEAGHKKIWDRIQELENQQGESHKHCLGQTVMTNTAVEMHRSDLLQKSIGELAGHVTGLEKTEGERRQYNAQIHDSAWVPHSQKQRKERWQRKRRQALVDYIENEISGESCPTEIEDVADTAIRLLKQHRAALQTIVEETLSQRTAFESLHRIRQIAREGLNEL